MALSYHANWDTCQYLDYPNPTNFTLPDLMDMEFQQSFSVDQNTPCFHSILDNTPEDYNRLLFPPLPEFEPYPYQYSHPYLHPYQSLPESKPCFSDGFVEFSTPIEKPPEFQCQMPPPVFSSIGSGGGGSSSNTLSAQSVAARQRRRKITERTQELGKLVPGGYKMNTAEMFGAAYKYIKYLQAQVGMLQLLGETQENEEAQLLHCEELHKLASSTKIQEKFYSHEKCLVPMQFIESIARDHELKQSNPVLANEINQLIRKSG